LHLPTFLTPQSVDVAVEIAHRRVSVAQLGKSGGTAVVSAFASEPLADGVVTPALTGSNIAQPAIVIASLKKAFERAGLKPPRRIALVVPDSIARLALLPFEEIPARPADLDQLVRWQLRKAAPFSIDEAHVSYAVASRDGATTTLATVLARREVIAEYEAVANALGMHAGLVDLASLNVANTVLASGTAPTGDWLLVHLTQESTTLAIFRGQTLVSYRNRALADAEPLSTLVHQTAMYHEDRLGGSRFARVLLSGAGGDPIVAERARREIAERLGVTADVVDARTAVTLRDKITVGPDVLDALAAPVGILLRDRKAA
jgi:type IV pilus assembly protein PilM